MMIVTVIISWKSFWLADISRTQIDGSSRVGIHVAASKTNAPKGHPWPYFPLSRYSRTSGKRGGSKKKQGSWEKMKTEPPRIWRVGGGEGDLFKALSRVAGIRVHKIMKFILNLNKQWAYPVSNNFHRLFQWLRKQCNGRSQAELSKLTKTVYK